MTQFMFFTIHKVLLISLLLFSFASLFFSVSSDSHHDHEPQIVAKHSLFTRRLLEKQEQFQNDKPKKKNTTISINNQNKLTKEPNLSSSSQKNQTKLKNTKTSPPTKNQTQFLSKNPLSKTELKKPNSTNLNPKKIQTLTKPISLSTKKSSDPIKQSSPKNQTTKPNSKTNSFQESTKAFKKKQSTDKTQNKKIKPIWLDDEEDDSDLVSEFRDLPLKFQRTLIPDLEKISSSSKLYITNANKQITKGFKPFVGIRYASTAASFVCLCFIIVPLLLVFLIFTHIKAYFSLQKILIFIQAYLAIYFTILSVSSLVTGLEPLRFFYATSQSTYIWIQVLQTLGYVFYLLLLLMYLVLVFSVDNGLGSKMLGLAQTIVGFAVGLHYYVAVFHRVVLHQPPKTNWKVHGIYATCFLVICLLSNADGRKKAYLEDGGEEGKKN